MNVAARFYGGSWDGQTKNGNFALAKRVYVAVKCCGKGAREMYERDRSRHKRDDNGEIVELAYRFVCAEDYEHVDLQGAAHDDDD